MCVSTSPEILLGAKKKKSFTKSLSLWSYIGRQKKKKKTLTGRPRSELQYYRCFMQLITWKGENKSRILYEIWPWGRTLPGQVYWASVITYAKKKKKREKEEKERRRKERNISKLFQRCISDIARHIIFLKRDLPFKSRQDRRIVQFTSTGD